MTTDGSKPDIFYDGKWWTWSEQCINPTKGFDLQPDGTLRPRELGFYVVR
jgi:hypothetical protein